MKKYLQIYKALLSINFIRLTSYRANFINSLISSLVWGTVSIATIVLLTTRTTTLYGWTREELYLLTGAYSIVIGIFHFLFSTNFQRFADVIHRGELDNILVKPADSQFLLTFWLVNYASLVRVILAVLFTFYILRNIHLAVNPLHIISFVILMFVGLLLIYSFWLLVTTLTIWFTRLSNVVELLYNLTGMGRYPPEVLMELKNYVLLFLLPLFLAVATPTKIILQKTLGGDVYLLVIFATCFFIGSRVFWKFALKYYGSASS